MAENKERLIVDKTSEITEPRQEKQSGEIIDLEKNREVVIPREVKNWMEKVEDDPSLNNQGQNNATDDTALQAIATTVTKINLPTNKRVFSEGFSKTVGDAGRWLSEFVFRLIKKNKGNVKFNEE